MNDMNDKKQHMALNNVKKEIEELVNKHKLGMFGIMCDDSEKDATLIIENIDEHKIPAVISAIIDCVGEGFHYPEIRLGFLKKIINNLESMKKECLEEINKSNNIGLH